MLTSMCVGVCVAKAGGTALFCPEGWRESRGQWRTMETELLPWVDDEVSRPHVCMSSYLLLHVKRSQSLLTVTTIRGCLPPGVHLSELAGAWLAWSPTWGPQYLEPRERQCFYSEFCWDTATSASPWELSIGARTLRLWQSDREVPHPSNPQLG